MHKAEATPLIEHFIELRKRLLWSFLAMAIGTGICFLFVEQIYGFWVKPLANAMGEGDTHRLIYTGLTEAFFTYFKVAFFSGVFLTFPIILLQIWKFIAPGLYKHERKAFLPFLIATPVLFFAGGAMVYCAVMPMAWHFFLSFQTTGAETVLPIQLEARVSEYLDLIMTLVFAFGMCFQMPVVLTLMAKADLITADHLKKFRRYAIVIIFTIAAILTPPDVLSQIILAVPLLGLYELSILLITHVQKQPDKSV
jgi:sec-independent protein translocase protein TatC